MTIELWHGGRRWLERPTVQPPRKKRYECGPGIYLSTSYERARKYAPGNGTTTRVTLDSNINWLEHKKLPLQAMLDYVRKTSGFRKRDLVACELQALADQRGTDELPLSFLVNLCVCHDVLCGQQGLNLANWLVEQGVDASLHRLNRDEQWVVVFNPHIIKSYQAIPAAQVSLDQRNLSLTTLSNLN